MLKVLVADENPEANLDCCQYLANDKNLDIVSSCSGISTINKYRQIQPNVLVINSDFKDISCAEIINELSSTSQERNNSNIILAIEDDTKRPKLNYEAKIYKVIYLPLHYDELKSGIEQYDWDKNIFYEPNEANLSALFYKINLYNEEKGARYFKYAIEECYKNPQLMKSLNTIFEVVSKHFEVSYGSVRPAMRTALNGVNELREFKKDLGIFKLFENVNSITPKNFIKIITRYYLKQKK